MERVFREGAEREAVKAGDHWLLPSSWGEPHAGTVLGLHHRTGYLHKTSADFANPAAVSGPERVAGIERAHRLQGLSFAVCRSVAADLPRHICLQWFLQ